jgi:HD-GYP domain-containing protein (c-di-GMP phosphodiesterase class II)
VEIVQIYAADLEPGMYVSALDRPWLETPFSVQGFRLESEDEVLRLQKYCKYVYVDASQSLQDVAILRRKVRNLVKVRRPVDELFPNRTLKKYSDQSGWQEEYPRALRAVMALSEGIDVIYRKLADTCVLDMVTVKKCVEPMIDSVVRYPAACIWLARVKQEDRYTYQHPLGASIWAVALGRQLGLPKTDLRSLAIGGLLFDIGKLGLERDLLETTRKLSEQEFQQVRSHVKLGMEMIQGSPLINTDVIDMIAHHHERHDGSGYPKGLRGDDIPVFARMAAIVDCYDAVTSHRGYARAISPSEAVKLLNDWKDVDFQGELVEAFIQAVGIYPAGTLVELSNGEIGVVMASDSGRRLRPRILVLLDADKNQLPSPRPVDLAPDSRSEDGVRLEILDSLEPNAHGIDLGQIPI